MHLFHTKIWQKNNNKHNDMSGNMTAPGQNLLHLLIYHVRLQQRTTQIQAAWVAQKQNVDSCNIIVVIHIMVTII